MERREPRRQVGVAAIDGERVLHQVIRADAEERDVVDKGVAGDRRGRRFDHDTERHVATEFGSAHLQVVGRLLEQVARLANLVDGDDEREHDAHVAVLGGAQQRAQLSLEQLRLVETHPDSAPAEERIRVARISADGHLVAADVECANDDGLSLEDIDDVRVGAVLLFFVGHRCPSDDEKFRAHQADTLGAAARGLGRFLGKIDVGAERDPVSVERYRIRRGEELELGGILRFAQTTLPVRCALLRRRIDEQQSRRAVENEMLLAGELRRRITKSDDRWQAERARENRDVRGARPGVSCDSADRVTIELDGEARRQIVSD